MAAASVFVMNLPKATYEAQTQPMQSQINVGYGSDVTIAEVAQAVGFTGRIDFDPSKPDGTPRKLMDSRRLNAMGWHAHTDLTQGLSQAYQDFLQHYQAVIAGSDPQSMSSEIPVTHIDPRYFRPTEVETLLGDPTKANEKLGWMREISLDQMVQEMVAVDLAEAKRSSLLKQHGYDVSVSLG